MAANKTVANDASVAAYLAAIADEARRADCEALCDLMARVTRAPATMWGTAIVGFGVHRYPLSGGREGEICLVGFSSRKGDINFYGVTDAEDTDARLARLGRHKRGKGCLYIRALADVDVGVLEGLLASSSAARATSQA